MANDSTQPEFDVLLVCGGPDERMLSSALTAAGLSVHMNLEACDGLQTGLERFGEGNPDLIVLDLSELGGDRLQRFMDSQVIAPTIPFVVIVAPGEDALGDAVLRRGAQDVLRRDNLSPEMVSRAFRYSVERNLAERALLESEERYRMLFEESQEAIFVSDRNGVVNDANKAALALFRITRAEAVGSQVGDRFADSEDRERFREAVSRGSGTIQDFEVNLVRGDGTEIRSLMTATRRHEPDGSPGGIQG